MQCQPAKKRVNQGHHRIKTAQNAKKIYDHFYKKNIKYGYKQFIYVQNAEGQRDARMTITQPLNYSTSIKYVSTYPLNVK